MTGDGPTLLIVALGQLGGAVLEQAARRSDFSRIVIAARNTARAHAKANNARVGAALEGRYPVIEVAQFDLNAADAPAVLAGIAPDVTFASPTVLPWWRLAHGGEPRHEAARAAPFATFMACHLAPMLALRDAWAEAALATPWVGASYPDVVNHILACTGRAPTCGTGNVLEATPKVRFVLADALGAAPDEIEVRLVAQHAFEYYTYGEVSTPAEAAPPFLLQALWNGRDVSNEARDRLFGAYPIPYERDFNEITASASVAVLEALVSTTPLATHVPAPNGLLGGYPVRIDASGVFLDLAPQWTANQCEQVNRDSLVFDGIEQIDAQGCVHFTAATRDALRAIIGRSVESMSIEDAPALADELRDAVLS